MHILVFAVHLAAFFCQFATFTTGVILTFSATVVLLGEDSVNSDGNHQNCHANEDIYNDFLHRVI